MYAVTPIRYEANSALWAKADALGCDLVVREDRNRAEDVGLAGKTFGIKDALRAASWRWDGQNKAWFAPSREAFLSVEV